MIKIRLKGEDVTIKKVRIFLKENIEDILTDYVERQRVEPLIAELRNAIENKEYVIVEVQNQGYLLDLTKLWFSIMDRTFVESQIYIPKLEEYKFDSIYECIAKYGVHPNEVRKLMSQICSLEEVPEDSNEETGDTSQDEAGAETSET